MLLPIYSNVSLIPEEIVKIISCNCKKGCKTATCGCRKHGLHCTTLCSGCHGNSCENIERISLENLESSMCEVDSPMEVVNIFESECENVNMSDDENECDHDSDSDDVLESKRRKIES